MKIMETKNVLVVCLWMYFQFFTHKFSTATTFTYIRDLNVSCDSYLNQESTTASGTCSDKAGSMISCIPHCFWGNLLGTNYSDDNTCQATKPFDWIPYIQITYRCCDFLDSNSNSDNTTNFTNNSNFSLNCVSRNSLPTNSSIGAIASVSCHSNETLISCSGQSHGNTTIRGKCVGESCFDYIETRNGTTGIYNVPTPFELTESDNSCHVRQRGGSRQDGLGIIAIAKCCNLIDENINTNELEAEIEIEGQLSCSTIWGELTDNKDDSHSGVSCPDNNSWLADCGGIDGGYEFDGLQYLPNDYDTYNINDTCFAYNGWSWDNTSQIMVNIGAIPQAVCCKAALYRKNSSTTTTRSSTSSAPMTTQGMTTDEMTGTTLSTSATSVTGDRGNKEGNSENDGINGVDLVVIYVIGGCVGIFCCLTIIVGYVLYKKSHKSDSIAKKSDNLKMNPIEHVKSMSAESPQSQDIVNVIDNNNQTTATAGYWDSGSSEDGIMKLETDLGNDDDPNRRMTYNENMEIEGDNRIITSSTLR